VERAAKSRGNVPSDLERWADQLLHSKVNWRKELRASARRQLNEVAGKREFSFKRPNRRQALSQVILPTLRDFLPRIGLVRDTSGSMGSDDLARTLAETRGILNMLGGEIIDIEVDCQVHGLNKVRSIKDVRMKGGGGTDMGVGINHAASLKPRPDLVVVMTDGETPWPSEAPPFKCIVMLTRDGARAQVPSWAKVILVD
jgi:predicted metal-dependent peptidase